MKFLTSFMLLFLISCICCICGNSAASTKVINGHWIVQKTNPLMEDYVFTNGKYCGFVTYEKIDDHVVGYYGAYSRPAYLMNRWETRAGAEQNVVKYCEEELIYDNKEKSK